jgi:hypothetical protein
MAMMMRVPDAIIMLNLFPDAQEQIQEQIQKIQEQIQKRSHRRGFGLRASLSLRPLLCAVAWPQK